MGILLRKVVVKSVDSRGTRRDKSRAEKQKAG